MKKKKLLIQRLGRYKKLRELYLRTERSDERQAELDELSYDVEWLMAELHRLSRRARVSSLVSHALKGLAAQLLYIKYRPEFKEDKACWRHIGKILYLSPLSVKNLVFRREVASDWFLKETEAGKEIDSFVPEVTKMKLDFRPSVKGKKLGSLNRNQLMEIIEYLVDLITREIYKDKKIERDKRFCEVREMF